MKRPNRNSSSEPQPDPARDEPIFRSILWVLVLSVVAGVGLALSGELVFGSEAMRNAGTAIGVISGMIYFVFRWLGRREAARRQLGRSPDR